MGTLTTIWPLCPCKDSRQVACESVLDPKVTVTNLGNSVCQCLQCHLSTFDGDAQVVNWTGNLGQWRRGGRRVTCEGEPCVTLGRRRPCGQRLRAAHVGATDENASNNDYTTSFATSSGADVTWTILTDNYPGETTWAVTNEAGATVWSGGPYGAAGTTYTETLCLPFGCYTLTVNDSYGDGICCAYGVGSFELTSGGTVLASGGEWTSTTSANFCLESADVPGCTDLAAVNYNPLATLDDGSCIAAWPVAPIPMRATTTPLPTKTTCRASIPEVIETSCGTCQVDCDGTCLADADGDGICDTCEAKGARTRRRATMTQRPPIRALVSIPILDSIATARRCVWKTSTKTAPSMWPTSLLVLSEFGCESGLHRQTSLAMGSWPWTMCCWCSLRLAPTVCNFPPMAAPKTREWHSTVSVWNVDDLDAADRELLREAHEAASKAYAPYSQFLVGGAVRLDNGVVVRGSNQENMAYPSGMCGERVAVFALQAPSTLGR